MACDLAEERGRRPQNEQIGDQRRDHRKRAQPSEQAKRRQAGKDRHRQPARQHGRRQNQRRPDQYRRALDAHGRIRFGVFDLQAVEK